MTYNISIFFILLFIILLIDIPMVLFVFKPNLWNNTLEDIQGKTNNSNKLNTTIGFILAYILIPLGIFIFVLPKIDKNNWVETCLLYGFLWGIISYGIFDFTNLVLFEKYSLKIAIIDCLWGGIMTSISLLLTYFISQKLNLIK
jgi:uncharacterized membrane protein